MAKKSKATHNDADLILKLYDLRREAIMRKARDFMTAQFWPQSFGEFKAVAVSFGTEQNAWFRQVWTYWDMACAIVLSGAIDEDLFFKSNGEPYFIYAKFKPFIEPLRKEINNPDFMANTEKLVTKSSQVRARVMKLEDRIQSRIAKKEEAKAVAQ